MAESDAVAAKVERACVDRTEAALLASRVGAEFAAVVLRASGPEDEPGEVFVAEPPVLAKGTGVPRAGEVGAGGAGRSGSDDRPNHVPRRE